MSVAEVEALVHFSMLRRARQEERATGLGLFKGLGLQAIL